MEPYIDFIGALQNSGFSLVKAQHAYKRHELLFDCNPRILRAIRAQARRAYMGPCHRWELDNHKLGPSSIPFPATALKESHNTPC